MKSIVYIEEQCREYISACNILIGIIEESEECTGLVYTNYRIEIVGRRIRINGPNMIPLCVVSTGGDIYSYGTRCRDGNIGLQLSSGILYLHVRCMSRNLRWGTKRLTVDQLPVEDTCNTQPHEYGILKLKYGITKEELFIPTIVKEYIRGVKI